MNPSSSSGRRLGLPDVFYLALLLLATAPAARAADYFLAPPGSTWCTGTANNNSLANPIPYVSATVANIIVSNPANPSDATVWLWFTTGEYLIPSLTLDTVPPSRRLFLAQTNGAVTLRYAVPATTTNMFIGPTWQSYLLWFNMGAKIPGFDHFEARDLTLDANWPAWAATNTAASPAYPYGFKLGGLAARATTGRVSGVRIRHCGANGIMSHPYTHTSPVESFPLSVNVPSFNFGANATNTWTIEDCEVSDFHAVRGGYFTGIMATTPNITNVIGPGQFFNNRVAVVRRCQVRGVGGTAGFAYGTAASAGVSFQDNVAVNCYGGMNMDTRPIRNIDLTNSVFLDVSFVAFFGGPGLWTHNGSTWFDYFTNFTVADNATRLSVAPLWQEYKSYAWQTNTVGSYTYLQPVTDPNLALGRFFPGSAWGLRLMGTHLTRFERNRFTTRPQAQFYEPDPTNLAPAVWRPWDRPTVHSVSGQICFQDGTNVSSDLHCSSVAMDFVNPTLIPSPTNATSALSALPTGLPADYVPGGRPQRVVLITTPNQLRGVGEVQMSQAQVTNGRVRVYARFVFHPTPRYGTNSFDLYCGHLRLRVRRASGFTEDFTPVENLNSGVCFEYDTSQTSGCDQLTVYDAPVGPCDPLPVGWTLEDADTAWATGEVLYGTTVRFERTPDVADDRRLCPGTLRLSRSGPTNANLSVVLEPVTSGVTRPALPGTVYDYVLCTNQAGTTNWITVPSVNNRWTVVIPAGAREVTVRVLPQAGDANQDVMEFETAYFRLVTDSAYAVAPPVARVTTGPNNTAAVPLWDGARYKLYELNDSYAGGGQAAMSAELLAAVERAKAAPAADGWSALAAPVGWPWQRSMFVGYGESGENEPTAALDYPKLQSFATGKPVAASEAMVQAQDAEPIDWRWQQVSRVQMDDAWLGDPAGLPPLADLVESEPSPWTAEAQESPAVMDSGYWSFSFSAAYDLNDLAAPFIAGNGTYWHSYLGRYVSRGGRWEAPAYDRLRWAEVGGGADYPYIWGVSDAGGLVGSYAGRACYVAPGLTSCTTLPSLSAGGLGEALAISGDGTRIVGWSQAGATTRPTRWHWNGTQWQATDWGDFESDKPGYANAVNSNGWVVGKTQVTMQVGTNTLLAWRAFRTNDVLSAANRALAELLPPPPDTEHRVTNYNSVAHGIDAAKNAVGSCDFVVLRTNVWKTETRAALWRPIRTTNDPPNNVLGTIPPYCWDSVNPPGRSEALAVTQGKDYRGDNILRIVGTGWLTPTGTPRAVLAEANATTYGYSYLRNLNDPQETLITQTGWILLTAEDVNAGGWIVGTGTYNGLQRAYVLVPQTAP